MDVCPDCGNHDMRVRLHDGAAVHRCALCGGEFGDRQVLEDLGDAAEARQHGFAVEVWPLVRLLARLPGLTVREASAGDEELRTLPFVEIGARDEDCLLQLENLAKALLLGAGGMACHWILEVEYRRHLSFVLKPRHGGGEVDGRTLRDARADLQRLRAQLERDRKLKWWQAPAERRRP